MYVGGITVEGLAAAPRVQAADLTRVVGLQGGASADGALLDGLELAFGLFDGPCLVRSLERWGVEAETQVDARGLVEAFSPTRPARWGALLHPHAERTLRLTLEVVLDPPQFGALRERALREPDLVTALGAPAGARLTVGLALRSTVDHEVVDVSLSHLALGGVPQPASPGERSPALSALLTGLARRFHRRPPLELNSGDVADADSSPAPDVRRRLACAREALRGAPFRLGHLGVAREAEEAWLLLERSGPSAGLGLPLDLGRCGPGIADEVGQVLALWLSGADIVALESPVALVRRPRAHLAWLQRLVEEPGAPVEQLWLTSVAPSRLTTLRPAAAPAPAGLRTLRGPG